MAFISNANGFTLGEGTFNNIHGDLVMYQGVKRRREEIEDASDVLGSEEPARKRRRKEDQDGIKIIRNKHLKLTVEIGSGPGFRLHSGKVKGRAVIVKVFNTGNNAREHLEATVAVSRGLLHPNVLRIEGTSAPTSMHHFIAYEDARRKTADGPLAAALRDDLDKSIVLAFKMISDVSSGLDYLNTQGITFPLGPESFDIFLDIEDRFLFSISPPTDVNTTHYEQDNTRSVWTLFNGLCQKVLRSANRVLHDEDIERTATVFNSSPSPPALPESSLEPSLDQAVVSTEEASPSDRDDVPSVPPRREFVWRTMDVPQSLAIIAARITRDLDMQRASINRLARSDGGSIHRCPGYVREEVTLATRTADSAVVSHDAPSIQEVCPICHEVVNSGEVFDCVCGQKEPGSRPTVKCRSCNSWSHRDCGPAANKSICSFCFSGSSDIPLRAEDLPARSDGEAAEAAQMIMSSIEGSLNPHGFPQSNNDMILPSTDRCYSTVPALFIQTSDSSNSEVSPLDDYSGFTDLRRYSPATSGRSSPFKGFSPASSFSGDIFPEEPFNDELHIYFAHSSPALLPSPWPLTSVLSEFFLDEGYLNVEQSILPGFSCPTSNNGQFYSNDLSVPSSASSSAPLTQSCSSISDGSYPNFPPTPPLDHRSPTDEISMPHQPWDSTATASKRAHKDDLTVEEFFTDMKKPRSSPSYDPHMAERLDWVHSYHLPTTFDPRSISLDIRTPEELAAVNGFLSTLLGRDVNLVAPPPPPPPLWPNRVTFEDNNLTPPGRRNRPSQQQ